LQILSSPFTTSAPARWLSTAWDAIRYSGRAAQGRIGLPRNGVDIFSEKTVEELSRFCCDGVWDAKGFFYRRRLCQASITGHCNICQPWEIESPHMCTYFRSSSVRSRRRETWPSPHKLTCLKVYI
jgi:hypothetical protein